MGTLIAPFAFFALSFASLAQQQDQGEPAAASATDAFYSLRLADLELTDGELPRPEEDLQGGRWDEFAFLMPYAVLEPAGGSGEAIVYVEGVSVAAPWTFRSDLAEALLCIRTSEAREVRGRLFVPSARWDGLVHVDFVVPASAAQPAAEERFHRAQAWFYDQMFERGVAGGAWFRRRRREVAPPSGEAGAPWQTEVSRTRPEIDSVEAYSLFGGGRAISENLQLERALPDAALGEDVALDDIEGIRTPAFDWEAALAAEGAENAESAEGAGDAKANSEPALDPLAALVPGDQHALFFPSFADLVRVIDGAADDAALIVEAFEESSTSAMTRERYERQLCIALDDAARALGSLVVASVALTGSDPYLRTGSDVAVLLEARQADALGAALRARQEAALRGGAAGVQRVEGEVEGVAYHGVVSPDRAVSSYLARIGDAFVVANSLAQLGRVAQASATRNGLGAQPEYRFFRRRYARSEPESAFLILPDAAIRRWCGPRWRIATKRRRHAAAFLAEIQARGAAALAAGTKPDDALLAPPAGAPPLGELRWTESGVHSSLYGSLAFETPIAELALERVSSEEARLYGLWRDGYERNWSAFFDPIAARIVVEDARLALDVSVMPLIVESDYGELRSITGDARLAPDAGGRHAGTLVHFAMALDTKGEMLTELNGEMGSLFGDAGVNVLDWLGDWLAIYVEPSPIWEELEQAQDRYDALENLWLDAENVPILLHVDVKSPLKLAAFLVALRKLADETAPGAARWETRSHGELRYVRISSDLVQDDDFAIYYATPPGAFLLTLSEKTLLAALDRLSAPPSPVEPWLGESAALELSGTAVELFTQLVDDDLERRMRHAAWNNLPILNEWKRLFPAEDPVALHERLWQERLVSPGGGSYVWNEEWWTMESTDYGHPGAPRRGPALPSAYAGLSAARFGLTLTGDGLRARVELDRAK